MRILRTIVVLFVMAAAAIAAQGPAPDLNMPLPPQPPPPHLPSPVQPIICDGTEEPCDPDKPWMRGHIEKFCGTAGMLAKLRKELPDREIKTCACRHKCDPNNKHKTMTSNRAWDGQCEARCNPSNCHCPHACDT